MVLQHGGKLNSVKAAHKLQKADFATSEQGCSPCSRCQLPKGCPSAGAALLLTPRDVQGPAPPASPRWHWDRAACAVTPTEAKPTASKAPFPGGTDRNCGQICCSQPSCATQACGGCQSRSDPHSRSPKAALNPPVPLPERGIAWPCAGWHSWLRAQQ